MGKENENEIEMLSNDLICMMDELETYIPSSLDCEVGNELVNHAEIALESIEDKINEIKGILHDLKECLRRR